MAIFCRKCPFLKKKRKEMFFSPENWCFPFSLETRCSAFHNINMTILSTKWQILNKGKSFILLKMKRISPFSGNTVFRLSLSPLCGKCNNTKVTMTIFIFIKQESSWYLYLTYYYQISVHSWCERVFAVEYVILAQSDKVDWTM